MTAEHKEVRKQSRSRVTNGRSLFLGDVDGRSTQARRFKDLLHALLDALGGREQVVEPDLSRCRRCAMLIVLAEHLDSEYLAGGDVDSDRYSRLVSTLNKTLSAIGLTSRVGFDDTRTFHPIQAGGQSLDEYLEEAYGVGLNDPAEGVENSTDGKNRRHTLVPD